MRQRVAQHLPGLLGDVHRLPVDSVCGALHEEPGRSAGDVARETRGEGQLVQALRTRQHIVVVRDEVHLVSPVGVVHPARLAHHHEVRRDRHGGGQAPQHFALGPQMLLQGIRGETLEVQLLRGVGMRCRQAGRQDLRPRPVTLRPERGAPRVVQGIDGLVPRLQPRPEGLCRVVGVVVDVVTPELVGHVPGDQRGVVGVPRPDRLHQPQGVPAEHRRGRAPVLSSAGPHGLAVPRDRKDLRVSGGQPRRRRRGRGRQIDADAVAVEQVHRLVEPAEVPPILGRLDPGPGEDRERDDVDARLAHQLDVLVPHVPWPLLWVVVRAVGERRASAASCGRSGRGT